MPILSVFFCLCVESAGYPQIGVSVSGSVHALDVATQRVLWSYALASPVAAAYIVQAGNMGDDSQSTDIIKIPHFYFDFTEADTDLTNAVFNSYYRSRDLADSTMFTYVGQTANGMLYALPNPPPVPASHPTFLMTPGWTSNAIIPTAASTTGSSWNLISATKDDMSVVHMSSSSPPPTLCEPTSPTYPNCLVGFHAFPTAHNARQDALPGSASYGTYNHTVAEPQHLLEAPPVSAPSSPSATMQYVLIGVISFVVSIITVVAVITVQNRV